MSFQSRLRYAVNHWAAHGGGTPDCSSCGPVAALLAVATQQAPSAFLEHPNPQDVKQSVLKLCSESIRSCQVCQEEGQSSQMGDEVRHLHELEIGNRFCFEDRPDETFTLRYLSPMGARINGGASKDQPCAAGAQIIPAN